MEAVLLKISPSAPVRPMAELDPMLAQRAEDTSAKLAALIQKSSDPEKMTKLLSLNDALTDLLAGRRAPPKLALHGLGLNLRSPGDLSAEPDAIDEDEVATPRIDKGKAKAPPEPLEVDKVLTPTFAAPVQDDEERRLGYGPEGLSAGEDEVMSPSQNDRWV
jgi:protein phosphatase 1 regulatory subunit 37